MTKVTRERYLRAYPKMRKATKRGYYLLDSAKKLPAHEKRRTAHYSDCISCACQGCSNKACRQMYGNQCIACAAPPIRYCHERVPQRPAMAGRR